MSERSDPATSRAVEPGGSVERALRSGVDATNVAWVVYRARRDAAGEIVDLVLEYANEAWSVFTGVDLATAIGRGIREARPALSWEGLLELIRASLTSGKPFEDRNVRTQFQLPPGPTIEIVVDLSIQPIGELVSVAYRDITAEVEAADRQAAESRRVAALAGFLSVATDPLIDQTRVGQLLAERVAAELGDFVAIIAARPDGDPGLVGVAGGPPGAAAGIRSTYGFQSLRVDLEEPNDFLPAGEPAFLPAVSPEVRDAISRLLARSGVDEHIADSVRSLIGVSIRQADGPNGRLQAVRLGNRTPYTRDDLALVQTLADAAGIVIDRQRAERDRATAASRFEAIFEAAPIPMSVYDIERDSLRFNRAGTELFGPSVVEQATARPTIRPGAEPSVEDLLRPTFSDAFSPLLQGRPVHVAELALARADRPPLILRGDAAPVLDEAGTVVGTVASFMDLTDARRLGSERDQLAQAIEQASESVEITDLDGLITYVNPAFERVTGYSRDEVIGRNPSVLKSGEHPVAFYEAMWAALTSGQPWVADFVNRRKDGTLFTEAAVISPIHDASGTPTGYVSVKRDVTRERALERRSDELVRERALIAETIRALRAGDSIEETAQAICRQVVSLRGSAAAQIFIFELDGRAVPIGFVVAGQADPELRRLPYQRSRLLHERATQGPWIEPWADRPWHPYNALLGGLGDHVVGYAPVRHDGRVIGLLVVDAASTVDEAGLAEDLSALVEFADLAGALVGRAVAERTEVRRGRDRVAGVISRRAFRPVFQPIVNLADGSFAGYEALTRFTDRIAPDLHFDEAAAIGMGPDLEVATLRAALQASTILPAEAWLNLNVSPELILAGEPLAGLLSGTSRQIVLEVTEHAAIVDYDGFRSAVTALGSNVQLAVDDAGAGYSSLRHILELRPAFVKLDRSIVSGLETDPARQAMVAGLLQFARSTACRLIPEGIETAAELQALRALDIQLGQGFLLGRPEPVAQ